MTAKDYLYQLWTWNAKIDARLADIAALKDRVLAVRSVGIRDDVVQVSHEPSAMEGVIVKYLDMELEVAEALIELESRRFRIIQEIHELDDARSVKILYKRYVEEKDWSVIADEMGYTVVYIRHISVVAEEMFEKAHPEIKKAQKNTNSFNMLRRNMQ